MRTNNLESRLSGLRAEDVPSCPVGLAATVLQRVRGEQQEQASEGDFAGIFRLSLRPQVLAAVFALAITLGALTTTVAASQLMPIQAKPGEDALGLSVIKKPYVLECCLDATIAHHDF